MSWNSCSAGPCWRSNGTFAPGVANIQGYPIPYGGCGGSMSCKSGCAPAYSNPCRAGQNCFKSYYNNGTQFNGCYTTGKFVRPRYGIEPIKDVTVTPIKVTPIYTLGTNTAGIFGTDGFCGSSPGCVCTRRYSTLYGGN